MKTDYASRILRTDTVYYFIQQVMVSDPSNWKAVLDKAIVGQSVLARYGNMRTYLITAIKYNLSPATLKIDDKETLCEYYKKKYLLTLKHPDQPLLYTTKTNRDSTVREIYLIPELCSLTGLPENLYNDRSTLQKLAEHTKLSPDTRKDKGEILLKNFLSVTSAKNELMLKNWNLTIAMQPHEVKGRVLDSQELYLGKGKVLSVPPSGQFFFKEPIVTTMNFTQWLLVSSRKDSAAAEQLVESLYQAGRTFGITIDYPKYIESPGISESHFISALANELKYNTQAHPIMVLFLLPPPSANAYAAIKKFAVTHKW